MLNLLRCQLRWRERACWTAHACVCARAASSPVTWIAIVVGFATSLVVAQPLVLNMSPASPTSSVTNATTPPSVPTIAQSDANATEASNTLRIVLLLPLESAALRRAAITVRDGANVVFASRKADVSVRECNYSGDGVVAAYVRCVDDKVDWVIGPLGRSDVATLALAKVQTLRPTLMLSPLGTVPPSSMTILSPDLESEGAAIAQQAVEDACRRPALVEVSGALANRVATSVLSFWRDRVATPLIKTTLGARDSWRRHADGWRRDNVDCVLFAGGATALSELRPYLRHIAVYVTSASYETPLGRTTDWTGVRIADSPWLIDAERAEFAVFLPSEVLSPTLARLYALGLDAARLAIAAGRDSLPPTFDGAIGQLTLKNGQYRRQPMLGEFRERNLVKVGP